MTHRFGVKYPDGKWSGPISPTAKDLKPYAKQHHGTIYEVGTVDDPGRHDQRKGEPWVFDDDPLRYQGDDEADAAADRADAENDRRKCYPDDLASKFGGGA
jgi:hypothetical protein